MVMLLLSLDTRQWLTTMPTPLVFESVLNAYTRALTRASLLPHWLGEASW